MFSIVFIVAIVVTIISFGCLNMFSFFQDGLNLIGAGALGVGTYLALKPQKKKELDLHLDNDNKEINELWRESFQKAVEDYDYIKSVVYKVKDSQLKRQIIAMQKTSGNILQYLKQHPEKIPLARRFIDYYQDSAAGLLEKYVELESTQLATDNITDIKKRTKDTLFTLNHAYHQQFEKIINDQIVNMDAEIKVMQQTMKAEGYSVPTDSDNYTEQNHNSTNYKHNMPRRKRGFHFDDSGNAFEQLKERLNNLPVDVNSSSTSILKRKLIAGGLGLLFGGFGAHKFYLGKTGWGVLYLLFSWTGIPFLVGAIEGIRFLFMSCDEFYSKYY